MGVNKPLTDIDYEFLKELEDLLYDRKDEMPQGSYTTTMFKKGLDKIAQKVGEEAIELVIEAKDNDSDLFKNEAADLLYHYLILLKMKEFTFADIEDVLKKRKKADNNV